MKAPGRAIATVAVAVAWLSVAGNLASAQPVTSGCTAPDLDDAIRRVDGLSAKPSDAELAAIAAALLDGIDILERRLGACRERLAAAHVYLALMHAWLPDTDTMGLTEEKARRLRSIAVSAQFEHALHLDAPAAREAMARVREALSRAKSPVLDFITVEFENAETALKAARTRGPDTAQAMDRSESGLAFAVGAYYGHPTGANTRGATFGPYVFAGVPLSHRRLSVGIAAGVATHGGFAPAAAAGLRYEFSRLAAVFVGFGTRLGARDSVPSRSGIVIGIDWSVLGASR